MCVSVFNCMLLLTLFASDRSLIIQPQTFSVHRNIGLSKNDPTKNKVDSEGAGRSLIGCSNVTWYSF